MGSIMDLLDKVLLPLLGAMAGGISAYAAIRANLAVLTATVAVLEKSIDRAHVRIDELAMRERERS